MTGVKWLRLLPAVDEGSEHVGRHGPKTLADEAVQEEVDASVEQRKHVCHVGEHVEQAAGTL